LDFHSSGFGLFQAGEGGGASWVSQQDNYGRCRRSDINGLLSDDFDEHPLSASAIEFAVEDLFPRSQVQNPFRTRDVPSAISCRKESRVLQPGRPAFSRTEKPTRQGNLTFASKKCGLDQLRFEAVSHLGVRFLFASFRVFRGQPVPVSTDLRNPNASIKSSSSKKDVLSYYT